MNFTNIPAFEAKMHSQGVSVAFFAITYSNCKIECVYSKDLKKFLFAIVDKNVGFTCSLNGTYANAFINHKEAVQALADCRNSGWNPKDFYAVLNDSLPNVKFAQVSRIQYQGINSVAVSNFEDRIYFNHWRVSNMSSKQMEKTIELLGNEVLEFCKDTGVIPVYYPYPTDRTMDVLNNFRQDYQTHNTRQTN
ncbi:MAG: hypothetical protein RBR23_01755 [Arcobacteraceae bacterium]|jgi:hypothetical protein|nr:hypothetical protein [Arcobacteraceae bacterium]